MDEQVFETAMMEMRREEAIQALLDRINEPETAMVVMWREVIGDLLKRLDELETAVKEAQRDLQFYARTTNRYKFRNAVAILEHVAKQGRREC